MTDDIVARLRDCTCVPHGELCREAAEEIERLRFEVERLREASSRGKPRGGHIVTMGELEVQRD